MFRLNTDQNKPSGEQWSIFEKKLLKKFTDHIFKLLLTPFESKFVNYSGHSEPLNIRKNSKSAEFFLRKRRFVHVQTFFKRSLCFEWLTNLITKVAKGSVKMWTSNFYMSFFKIISCSQTEVSQKVGQYIRMLSTGWFILTEFMLPSSILLSKIGKHKFSPLISRQVQIQPK